MENSRKTPRREADFYPTPSSCVDRLLDILPMRAGHFIEPAAGEGDIVKAVNARIPDVKWTCHELREQCRPTLEAIPGVEAIHMGSFLESAAPTELADVLITNPPYCLAMEFLEKSLKRARIVAMLLRTNFLSSQERHDFMVANPPDVYIFSDRPSFTSDGQTDTGDYSWMVWERGRRGGAYCHLAMAEKVTQRVAKKSAKKVLKPTVNRSVRRAA